MAKILVVEDEPDLRETIVEELNDEGHMTIEAENGAKALEALAHETPDLILSDITMPQMNGYQFFRSLKEKYPQHSQTPFIFLSALSDRNDELKGLRLGVDDYMTKPIDFDLLLARIELSLRRRPAAAAPPVPEHTNESEPADIDRLKAISENNGGKVQTGKFETVSLEAIQAKLGDSWSEVADQIMICAEAVIRENLDPDDVLQIKPPNDFVVCFAELSEEEADAKVQQIRDSIWDRIFKETGDEELSSVDAQAFELSVEGSDADGALLDNIDKLADQQRTKAQEGHRKTLEQVYHYEEFHALTLLGPTGSPTKVKLLAFEKKLNDRARKLLSSAPYDSSFLVGLHRTTLERFKEKKSFREAFHQAAMLLPVHFSVMSDPEGRDGMLAFCKDMERIVGAKIFVEITHTPDRIKSHMKSVKPLPVGRQVQFLELRRIAQMDGVELGELTKRGVAFVTMLFDHALKEDKQALHQVTKALERVGIKFFIKDIPEGRLFEAQAHHAHLYAMQR